MAEIVRNRRRRVPKSPEKGVQYGHDEPSAKRGQTRRATKPKRATPPQAGSRASLGPSGLPMLRTSERGTYKRCRWKWYKEFVELRKPLLDSPPLRFGGLFHEAMAIYYKPGKRRGPHPRPEFERLYAENLIAVAKEHKMRTHEVEEHPKWLEHLELGIDMLDAYIEKYGKDDEWEVLATELPFRVPIQDPSGKPLFWYVGTIDGVWRNRRTGRIVIPDHKTAAAIQTGYLSMDPQATAYWTFGWDAVINSRLVPPGTKLDGMLFNFVRKAKKDNRPYQVVDGTRYYLNLPTKAEMKEHGDDYPGSISKKQPAALHARVPVYRDFNERARVRQNVVDEFIEMEMVRQGKLKPHKSAGQFTCPGCWALDICELHEMGADHKSMEEATTRSWDPYAAQEVLDAR